MKLVGALFRDDVVDGAHQVAVLGRRTEGQHLHFIDRVGIWIGEPLAPVVVGDVDAVELKGVFVERAAEALGPPLRIDAAVAAFHRPGSLRHEIVKAIAARRRVLDPIFVERRADFAGGRVNNRTFAGHGERFRQLSDVERHIMLEGAADVDAKALDRNAFEAGELERQRVYSRRHVGKPVAARLGRDCCLRAWDVRTGHADRHSGQHRSGGILDHSDDVASGPLRVQIWCQKQREHECKHASNAGIHRGQHRPILPRRNERD